MAKLKFITDQNRLDAILDLIPEIVGNDPTITKKTIQTMIAADHAKPPTIKEIENAINELKIVGRRTFCDFKGVDKSHAAHMDKFMLIVTNYRMIKGVHRIINAPNGSKYNVKMVADNGAVVTVWFGVNTEKKYVAYGVGKMCSALYNFDELSRRSELISSLIEWTMNEFEGYDGIEKSAEILNKRTITIAFPTPDQLSVFVGFQSIGTLIGGKTVDGIVHVPKSNPERSGIDGASIFYPIGGIQSIKINIQY